MGIPCAGTPTVKDIDGNIYNTVQIGTQCWIKENLRVSKYRDGSIIPLDASGGTTGNNSDQTWSNRTTGARTEMNTKLPEMIKLCKKEMKLPIYVGFGISKPEHAKNVINLGAQGAICGSAFCIIIEENLTNPKEMQEKINKFCKEMSEAVKNV